MTIASISRSHATLSFDSLQSVRLPLASACSALGLPCAGPRSARLALILWRIDHRCWTRWWQGLDNFPVRRGKRLHRAYLDALDSERRTISRP